MTSLPHLALPYCEPRFRSTAAPQGSTKTVITVCAWCEPNPKIADFINHTICAKCAEKLAEELT